MKTKIGFDKFKQCCADVGKPGTLVSDGGGKNISNKFKRFCRNQKFCFEKYASYTSQENEKNESLGNFCCHGLLSLG